ncbi:MAG: hypothetical protein JWQ43_3223 [Glaciihabitans sp.]|nr:hypothetical protein [Glaciihabitans sp.]
MTLFESDPYGTQYSSKRPPNWRKRGTVFGILLAVACAGGLILTSLPSDGTSSPISALRPFAMSKQMTGVAEQLNLTGEGRDILVDARPELLTGAEILEVCSDTEDGTENGTIVGCFIGGGMTHGRIAIFQPADERLAPQIVTTAAHELLHAAYTRLADHERATLDALLEERWSLVAPEDPIQAAFAGSVGSDDSGRSTEQFAYLGSTVAEAFEPALEHFYDRVFTNRATVVAAHTADLALFDGLHSEYQVASDALLNQEQANAAEGAQLDYDRAQREADLSRYTGLVDEYNAQPAADQARQFVLNPDGSFGEPWGDYLQGLFDSFATRDADIAARQASLDLAEAAAVVARADVEARLADINALSAASVPAAG